MPATATMPTPEQLKAYAESLPDIYRMVLKALHAANPDRREGDGVHGYEFWQQLVAVRSEYVRGDYAHALENLEASEFVRYDEEIGFYMFTPLGEDLMAAVTGKRAKKVVVPPLPKPNW